jgi:molybdenum cofactor synthesis domain-containing protein
VADHEGPRAVVVTVSDGAAHGAREDTSGESLAKLLREHGWRLGPRVVVPDDVERIVEVLRTAAVDGVDLVVTTGGTGFGPRDVTPEATLSVADRRAPGLAERMRAVGRATTPMADLSRGEAVMVGRMLVLNTPGSRKGAVESLEAVIDLLPHAVQLLGGDTRRHPTGHGTEGVPGEHVTLDDARPSPRERAEHEAHGVHTHGHQHDAAPHEHAHDHGRDHDHQHTPDGHGDDHHDRDRDGHGGHDPDDPCAFAHSAGIPDDRRPGTLVAVYSSPLSSLLLAWGRDLGYRRLVLVEPTGTAGHAGAHADEVVPSVAEAPVDGDTDVVITDHHRDDIVVMTDQMLRTRARYLGLMGSARHTGPHVDGLRDRGWSDDEIARIERPIGLDIGSKTPPEIALSVLAGIVADRQGKR